jgi:protein-disulfide isomerase
MKMIRWLVLSACLLLPAPLRCPAAQPAPDFVRQFQQVLEEHPEFILDMLRDNSEIMLDIVERGSNQRRSRALLRQWQEDVKTPKGAALDGRPTRGPAAAPVTLVAFSDFTCAYCQQSAFTVENLLKRYPEQIRFVFKQIPVSDTGRMASQWFLAAWRQDRDKAWRFYALLFDRQQRLLNEPMAALREAAGDAQLDVDALTSALQDRAATDEILNLDAADAKALGFHGTPYFLVNDLVIRGALPLEHFIDAVEFALKNPKKPG